MCNIAGYSGNCTAAPILIDMIKKQEGFCGGFYTGITTFHEGKLYSAKVIGGVDRLLAETDAINFPGTTGIIHSRSNSKGDWRWGHPFISNDESLSVVLNGAIGKYNDICTPDKFAKKLIKNGYSFSTASPESGRGLGYATLPDGSFVHFSEVVCHLTDYYKKNGNPVTHIALEKAFLDLPAEIVCLAMNENDGNAISYAKYNMPMSIARTETEVFLSSMSYAFPEDRDFLSISELPQESSGIITVNETKIHNFRSPLKMGRITPSVMSKAYDAVLKTFETEEPVGVGALNNAICVLWGDDVDLRYPVTYSIIEELVKEDRIQFIESVIPGAEGEANPELTAVRTKMKLK